MAMRQKSPCRLTAEALLEKKVEIDEGDFRILFLCHFERWREISFCFLWFSEVEIEVSHLTA